MLTQLRAAHPRASRILRLHAAGVAGQLCPQEGPKQAVPAGPKYPRSQAKKLKAYLAKCWPDESITGEK